MFTGIVHGTGEIISTSSHNTVTSFDIRLPDVTNLNIGASVSINGVCLTVVAIESDIIQFDAINETLERAILVTIVGDL